jgi:hypothetical protein
MVTLRYTKKLQNFMGAVPAVALEPTNTVLGDWYGNLIGTSAGELILFVSDRSLLSVAIPAWEPHSLRALLVLRVGKLLGMLNIDASKAEAELRKFEQIQIANTESRSVIGSMNEIASYYYYFAEDLVGSQQRLSLSEAEINASKILLTSLKYRYPSDVARDLFRQMTV